MKESGAPDCARHCSRIFFAVTFILNHAISLSGGSWLWSAALRYLETTQSLEVLFTIAGELALLRSALPSFLSWTGMLLVILGMNLPKCDAVLVTRKARLGEVRHRAARRRLEV